jgi:hypothetical protein
MTIGSTTIVSSIGTSLRKGTAPTHFMKDIATDDNYHWVCQKCFDDFTDMFKWNVGL